MMLPARLILAPACGEEALMLCSDVRMTRYGDESTHPQLEGGTVGSAAPSAMLKTLLLS